MQYELSSEVEKVANSLIKQFHSELGAKKIDYAFEIRKDKTTGESQHHMRGGKPVMADIDITTGRKAFLASGEARTDENGPDPRVAIFVSKHAWNQLTPKQREAMLDEQLCLLHYDEESGRPKKLAPDAEVSLLNLKRFGLWRPDLEAMARVAQEFPLFAELDESVTEPQKAKVVKAGAAAGNGKDADAEPPKSDLPSIQRQVAEKRGRAAHAGTKQ